MLGYNSLLICWLQKWLQNYPYRKHKLVPYSRKISRAKIFKVDLPQNSSWIKFQRSTRLSLHLYAIIRFSRINFRGNSEIHENSKIYCPRKIPASFTVYDCYKPVDNIYYVQPCGNLVTRLWQPCHYIVLTLELKL